MSEEGYMTQNVNIIVYERVFLHFNLEAVALQPLPLGCAPNISKPFVY